MSALLIVLAVALFWQHQEASKDVRTDPISIGFIHAMASHHDQAAVIADIMLAGDSQLRGLALSILRAQLLEIGQMRGWLQAWKVSPTTTSGDMSWMLLSPEPLSAELNQYLIDCRSSPGGMPGLATFNDLNQLRKLTGAARDLMFIDLMIRHHHSGLPMAKFAARHAKEPLVRALARDIVKTQSQEISMMERVRTGLTNPI